MRSSAKTPDAIAHAILVDHQRGGIEGCICGWADLGKSHAAHQVAKLREAGLLVDDVPRT